jgi:hypothetical protein
MEDNPITFSIAIIQLLPVIVGGFIAIGGSIMASIISHKKQTSQKKAELKVQKLEELLNLVYESVEWVSQFRDEYLHDGPKAKEYSPINLAKVLSKLYFSTIEKEVDELEASITEYKQWVMKEVIYKDKHKTLSPTWKQDFNKVYGPIISRKNILEEKLSQLSSYKF